MRYLVTGGAGFIGSHLVEKLVSLGSEVVVLDNLSTGFIENLEPYLDRIEFVDGDIRDLDTCRAVCEGVDHVLHQAALGSVPRSIDNPFVTHEVNTTGTLNVMWAAKEARVRSFVAAMSSSYFGDVAGGQAKTDDMPANPISPYGVSKATCEHYIRVFAKVYNFHAIGLRYFNVFGPRQSHKGPYAAVIPRFIQAALSGQPATIYGDGEQSRDFTYVGNVVRANILASLRADSCPGVVLNVACGEQTSLNQLHDIIQNEIGVRIAPHHEAARNGDIKDSLADISGAQALLGYEPSIKVSAGIRQTVQWWVEQTKQENPSKIAVVG